MDGLRNRIFFFYLVKIERGESKHLSKEEFQINKKTVNTTKDILDSGIYSHKPKSAIFILMQNPLYQCHGPRKAPNKRIAFSSNLPLLFHLQLFPWCQTHKKGIRSMEAANFFFWFCTCSFTLPSYHDTKKQQMQMILKSLVFEPYGLNLWENLAVTGNGNISLGEALIFVLPQFSHLQNLGLEGGISKVTHTETLIH